MRLGSIADRTAISWQSRLTVTPNRCARSAPSLRNRLAGWLVQRRVKTVAIESTGVYWIPLYEILEERGFEVLLVNARDVHNVRGRKSDVSDCEWLRELHSVGLLRASFRPAAAIVPLRSYLRQRATLVEEAATRIQRMQKALTAMNLKLHTVLTDLTGQTGLKIVRSIRVRLGRCQKKRSLQVFQPGLFIGSGRVSDGQARSRDQVPIRLAGRA